jgi:hypothetical protein
MMLAGTSSTLLQSSCLEFAEFYNMRTEHSNSNVVNNTLWEELNIYLACKLFGPKDESVKNNKPIVTQFSASLTNVM